MSDLEMKNLRSKLSPAGQQGFDEMCKTMDACEKWFLIRGRSFGPGDVVGMAAAIVQRAAVGAVANTNEEMLNSIADHLKAMRTD